MMAANFRSRPFSPRACAPCSPIRRAGRSCREEVAQWLAWQEEHSLLPERDGLLVETFPSGGRHFLVAYPFEGRLAHQTLGMLLTRRLERARLRPLGFACNDYGIGVWALGDIGLALAQGRLSLDDLFAQDMLGDDLEAWLAETALMKRSFRACAIIAGLIERRHPGHAQDPAARSRSRPTSSTTCCAPTSLATSSCARRARMRPTAFSISSGSRMMLSRIRGRIRHKGLERVSPLAVVDHPGDRPRGRARRGARRDAGGSRGRVDAGSLVVTMTMRELASHKACLRDQDRRRYFHRRRLRRALARERAHACRRRSASREGLVLRAARHAAAALRHGRDARRARGDRRALRRRARVVSLGDGFHDDARRGATRARLSRRARAPAARARLGLGHGQSRSAMRPPGCRATMRQPARSGASRRVTSRRLERRRARARSPAICIPWRMIAARCRQRAGAASRDGYAPASCRPSAPMRAGSICATRPSPICSISRAFRPSSSARRASTCSTPRPSAAPGGHNVGHDGLKGRHDIFLKIG